MFGKKINNMLKQFLIVIGLFMTSNQLISQTLPDLGDSILIYKYSNSDNYQFVHSTDSTEIIYYSDSTVKAKGKYLRGKRNGNWSAFYPDGTIQTFGYITDSSFYGKWEFYHENGFRKAKGRFKYTMDDKDSSLLVLKMSGKWKFWNNKGQLIAKTYFSPYRTADQSKYGKFKERYPSGKIKTTGEYHKGSKIGTWHHYYENGTKKLTAYYQYKSTTDYPIGSWVYWDEKGNILKKEIYKDGVLVETITY